jgi:tetratricopeptide (TPR) repeat protein
VVTFPIQFTDVQQEIVLNAAFFAGFTSVGLLPKHLAAVAFYKALYPVLAEKKTTIAQQYIFILDISWSAMTATVILNVSGNMVIQAMTYESKAGARDIDLALVDFVNQDIFSRCGQDISGMPYIQATLLKLCQGVTMTLLYSSETTLKFSVPEVNLVYELVISWELLHSIITKLKTKIHALIQGALALAGMEEDNIAIVLCKGTNMPFYKANIIPFFQKAIFHSISDQFSGAKAAVMSGFLKLENLPLKTENKFWIAHASSTLDILWDSWSKSQHLTLHHQNVQNELTEFEQDINQLKAALRDTAETSDRYLDLHNDLCAMYLKKYKTTGNIYDLNEAIVAVAKALGNVDFQTSAKPEYLANLSTCLERQYSNSGDIKLLNLAILYQSYAINSLSSDNPNIASMYNNYGTLLRERGEHINGVQDIVDAAKNIQKAIGIFTKTEVVHDVPGLLAALGNLGNTCQTLYKSTGKLDDIHHMIKCYEMALDLTPNQNIQRASNLNGCANAMLLHYNHLGDLEDLNKAIQYSTEAIKYTPDSHPSKSIYLSVFVSVLQASYDHSKDLNTLDKAIEIQQKILTLSNHQSDQSTLRTKLGNLFSTKFNTSIKKNLKDLNLALQNYEFAVHLTKEHEFLKKFVCLNNYGIALKQKFEVSSDIQDLEKGITVLEQAIECIDDGSDKTKVYCNLAQMHLKYYEHIKDEEHRSKAMELCRNVTSSESLAPLFIKFGASQTWITAAAWSNNGPMMQAAVTTMVDLLSQLAWPGQSLASQINVLKRARQCACDAAAIAINFKDIDSALAWLEQGRTLAWNQILQIRSPFDDLKKENPELAEKIISLSQELEVDYNKKQNKDLNPIPPVEKSSNFSRNALALERNKLLEQARTIPGFEGLMKTKEYSEFGVATYDGPVIVINVSRYRCDAVIITAHATPFNLPLEAFSLDQAKELQKKVIKALRSSRSLQRCADSNDKETSNTESDNEESTRFRKRKASKREAIDAQFREILQELYIKVVEPILNVLGVGIEVRIN